MAATSCGILGSKTHEPAIVKLKRWQTSCGIFSQETHEAAILKVYGGHDILWNTQSKNTRTSYSKTSRWHDILWNIQSRNPWTSYIKTVRWPWDPVEYSVKEYMNQLHRNVWAGIRFSFRLQQQSGLLMFAASENQQEYIAVIFRAGRPRFMYDTRGKR